MGDITTITIKRETWRELNSMRECGESFDKLIRRILKLDTEKDKE